jgi:phosphatidylinositol 3-kinase
MERWAMAMPQSFKERIYKAHVFADACRRATQSGKHQLEMIKQMLKAVTPTSALKTSPITIDMDGVKLFSSITRPILIPIIGSAAELFKPEDIRKDYLAMTFIRICDEILKKDLKEDFHIKTYDIRPTSSNAGFIQIVQDSTTFYELYREHRTNLFNYVKGNLNINDIRERFIKSCAAYCVITYLLGHGDRHQDNIMITRDGELFHIDYGYILGAKPRHLSILLPGGTPPEMRIDYEMVDAFGGQENYQRFKDYVDVIYNCLRRHVDELTCVLRLFVQSVPQIDIKPGFDHDELMREILRRFVPSDNHEEAKIHIRQRVETSTASTAHFAIVDELHHQARSNIVMKAVSSGWSTIRSTFF